MKLVTFRGSVDYPYGVRVSDDMKSTVKLHDWITEQFGYVYDGDRYRSIGASYYFSDELDRTLLVLRWAS